MNYLTVPKTDLVHEVISGHRGNRKLHAFICRQLAKGLSTRLEVHPASIGHHSNSWRGGRERLREGGREGKVEGRREGGKEGLREGGREEENEQLVCIGVLAGIVQ